MRIYLNPSTYFSISVSTTVSFFLWTSSFSNYNKRRVEMECNAHFFCSISTFFLSLSLGSLLSFSFYNSHFLVTLTFFLYECLVPSSWSHCSCWLETLILIWTMSLCYMYRSGPCNEASGSNCNFIPSLTENDNVTSSIMSFSHLPHVKRFCDPNSHKPYAPTKHNFLCGRKSVSDIIFSHPDFRNITSSAQRWVNVYILVFNELNNTSLCLYVLLLVNEKKGMSWYIWNGCYRRIESRILLVSITLSFRLLKV